MTFLIDFIINYDQMCHDRGYKVSDFELNEDLDEFSEYFQDRSLPDDELNILLSHVWNGAGI